MGFRPVLISIMALFSFLCRSSADTLDVVFKLTDFDYHPLPGVEVRVVLGTPEDWQGADAGVRFVTDARGQHQFSTSAAMERHLKKRPTNFVSSLTRLPEVADHLQIAPEVEYAGFRWLHVFQIERFAADGDGLQDGYTFYSRDEQGGFTRRAVAHGPDWAVGDLGVLRLNRPAHPGRARLGRPQKRRAALASGDRSETRARAGADCRRLVCAEKVSVKASRSAAKKSRGSLPGLSPKT